MHAKHSIWFETVVRYRKMSEDGTEKAVDSIDEAKDYVNEYFKGGMVDYELSSVSESKVLDVTE